MPVSQADWNKLNADLAALHDLLVAVVKNSGAVRACILSDFRQRANDAQAATATYRDEASSIRLSAYTQLKKLLE